MDGRTGLDSGSSVISGWEWMRRKDSLSEANAHLLLEIIQEWKAFQGDRDGLEIAIRRLAILPSRAVRFDAEDRLLDTAIALVLQSQIMVKMSEASLVVAVAGSDLMASSPTGPGQHRFL